MSGADRRSVVPIFAIVVGALLLLLWQALVASPHLSVTRIEVIGHETLTPRQVEDIAGIYRGMSMLTLRTTAAEERLLADHRVVEAVVNKRWPNRVDVSIVEGLGLAVVPYRGNFVELDRTLRVVSIDADFSRIDLPIVSGLSLSEVRLGDTLSMMSMIAARDVLSAVPAAYRHLVSEINILDTERIYLYMNDGVRVEIGGTNDVDTRLRLLPAALHAYRLREFTRESVPTIDLSGDVVVFRGR